MKQIIKLGVGIIVLVATAFAAQGCEPSDEGQKNADADIISFTFEGITAAAVIDPGTLSVTARADESCDLSSLTPEFKLSAGAKAEIKGVPQVSGQTQNDFRTPRVYDVFSEDGQLRKGWTVTISGGIPGESGKERFDRLPLPTNMTVDFILVENTNATYRIIKNGDNIMIEHKDTELEPDYMRQDLYVRSGESYHYYYRDTDSDGQWCEWCDGAGYFPQNPNVPISTADMLLVSNAGGLMWYADSKYCDGESFSKQAGTYTVAGEQCSMYRQDVMGVSNYYVGPYELCLKMENTILNQTSYEATSYSESAQSLTQYINEAISQTQNP